MAKNVTLQMIADRVGVSKSTVSDVLRSRNTIVKVSETTKSKIHRAVKDLNYVPNAAARALVTGKTNNIGFLLSSKTTLGLSNIYFSSIMSGVQSAAGSKGYNCVVNCYDLSSIKEFVMPSKVRRKTVDGLVISGRIEEDVLQTFIDSSLPFILVGENADFPVEGVLAVARNIAQDWMTAFEYLNELGHKHIEVAGIECHQAGELFSEVAGDFQKAHPESGIKISSFECLKPSADIMQDAYAYGRHWAESGLERATAVIGHDQWCIGFLNAIMDAGYSSPKDVSVISTCDTPLCRWFRPSLTAIDLPLFEGGKAAAEVLLEYIDKNISWMEANRRAAAIWKNHDLVVRDSTGKAN